MYKRQIEAGAEITRELAEKADNAGVNLVELKLDDPMKEESRKIKVITNGCVDAQGFFSFDVKECGINERCSFEEIKKILDTTSDVEEQKELLRQFEDSLNGREYERRKSFGDQVKSYIRDNAERFKEKFEKK